GLFLSLRRGKTQVFLDASPRELVHGGYRRGDLGRDLVENGEDLSKIASGVDVPPLAPSIGGHRAEVLDVRRQHKSHGPGLPQASGHRRGLELALQRRLIGDQDDHFHRICPVTGLGESCRQGLEGRFPLVASAGIARQSAKQRFDPLGAGAEGRRHAPVAVDRAVTVRAMAPLSVAAGPRTAPPKASVKSTSAGRLSRLQCQWTSARCQGGASVRSMRWIEGSNGGPPTWLKRTEKLISCALESNARRTTSAGRISSSGRRAPLRAS